MDDSRPVVMVQEGNNTTLVFKGNEVERDDFLHDFYSLVLEYFKDSEKSFYKPFLYIFKEIVKNIYDHGIGKATLVMIDTQESFSFDFIDENPTLVTFAEISAIDIWKKKSKHNFGVGLGMIQDICHEHNIVLRIDDTKGGINYHGLYFKSHSS